MSIARILGKKMKGNLASHPIYGGIGGATNLPAPDSEENIGALPGMGDPGPQHQKGFQPPSPMRMLTDEGAPALAGPAPQAADPMDMGREMPQPGVDLAKDRGTPTQMVEKMPAGDVEKAIEASTKHVGGMKGGKGDDLDLKKAEINRSMRQGGSDPVAAFRELRDERLKRYKDMYDAGEITKERHTGLKNFWKNIFNVIPREDMGLVLMDFGLRAMMAGEQMGDLGALGAAGSGALQGIQDRRAADFDRQMAMDKAATEGALAETKLGLSGREMDLKERELDMEAYDASNYLETEQGIMPPIYDESGRLIGYDTKNPLRGRDGALLKPYSASRDQFSWQAKDEELAAAYPWMPQQDRVLMSQTSMDPLSVRAKADSEWAQLENRYLNMTRSERAQLPITIGGKQYTWPDIPDKIRLEWIRDKIVSYGYSRDTALRLGGADPRGALPANDAFPSREQLNKEYAEKGWRPLTEDEYEQLKELQSS